MREYSKQITEVPTFLSAISMVVDDEAKIIESLQKAERKSPPVYLPTREFILALLEGKLSYQTALNQACALKDSTERKCAIQVLEVMEDFLAGRRHAPIAQLPPMNYMLPNNMKLSVAPLWIQRCAPERLLVLHFWETPLTDWQLRAAGGVIQRAVAVHQPQLASADLCFISASIPEWSPARRCEHYNWTRIRPLNAEELTRFWNQFVRAWKAYQSRPPRLIHRRRGEDLLDLISRPAAEPPP